MELWPSIPKSGFIIYTTFLFLVGIQIAIPKIKCLQPLITQGRIMFTKRSRCKPQLEVYREKVTSGWNQDTFLVHMQSPSLFSCIKNKTLISLYFLQDITQIINWVLLNYKLRSGCGSHCENLEIRPNSDCSVPPVSHRSCISISNSTWGKK